MQSALHSWWAPLEAARARSVRVPLMGRAFLGFFVCAFVFFAGADFAFAQEKFFVEANDDATGREEVEAERLFLSYHARIMVESSYWKALEEEERVQVRVAIAALVSEFDGRIYPMTRILLGSEWNPGIDRDPRVILFITPMRAGVFSTSRPFIDETRVAGSNESEIVYVNANALSEARTKAALASSFAELVAYNQRVVQSGIDEEPWVVALAGAYVPTYLGYDTPFADSQLAQQARSFLNAPSNSFVDWNGGEGDRASVSLFAHFVAGRYGTPFFSYLMRASRSGQDAVTLALRASDSTDVFTDALSAWAIASYVNGSMAEGDLYAYTHPGLGFSKLRVVPEYRAPIGEGSSSISRFLLGPASAQWVRYTPKALGSNGLNSLFLKLNGFDDNDTTVFAIETTIDGASRLKKIIIKDGKGEARVDLFGTYVLSVVLVPTNTRGEKTTLQVEAYQRESDRTNPEGALPEGALIRAANSDKVYVVQGESRRWIQSPDIFNAYEHLRWEDVREVASSTLAWYRESFLVRVVGDRKVYEVTAGGTKRWLNMTAGAFERSGRLWADVFDINEKELLWYADGEGRS